MFVVTTQILENYGAHNTDGKYFSGNNYWKMKGGNDYLVTDLDRHQDAMAFVAAAFIDNNVEYKEFPIEVKSLEEWEQSLFGLDPEYAQFLKDNILQVSPKTGRQITKGYYKNAIA